jgi:hypothetical protein
MDGLITYVTVSAQERLVIKTMEIFTAWSLFYAQSKLKKGSFRKRVSSLRKSIFKSLQNIRLGRRSGHQEPASPAPLQPPDVSALVAPLILGRPPAEAAGEVGRGRQRPPMTANTYSNTPRQTSSDDEEEDYYDDDDDDDDDDDEDYNDGANGNVVYASLTGLPTQKQDDSGAGMERDEILDDDDSNYDDDENDVEEADAMPRAAAMAMPVPAPRASRLVVDQPQV